MNLQICCLSFYETVKFFFRFLIGWDSLMVIFSLHKISRWQICIFDCWISNIALLLIAWVVIENSFTKNSISLLVTLSSGIGSVELLKKFTSTFIIGILCQLWFQYRAMMLAWKNIFIQTFFLLQVRRKTLTVSIMPVISWICVVCK